MKKVGGFGLGLVGKAYNAATGKRARPSASEEVKVRVRSTRHIHASDSGGIACKDAATVKDQRSVFSEVIKQIGKNVFAGRDLMCARARARAAVKNCNTFACTQPSPSGPAWASASLSSSRVSRRLPPHSSRALRLLTLWRE